MADRYTLTIDLTPPVGSEHPPGQALGPAGIFVAVEKAKAELVYPVGDDTHETLYPTRMQTRTDERGQATFELLPSRLAGPYRVTIGNFRRTIWMPEDDAPLWGLSEFDADAAMDPTGAHGALRTDMSNLDADLSDEEKAAIRAKIDAGTGDAEGGGLTAEQATDLASAANRDGDGNRQAANANRVRETDAAGVPAWVAKRTPAKATNDQVDAVAQTGTALSTSLADRSALDDTGFLTVRKAVRLAQRLLKTASATVRGVVLLARTEDVGATETDTSRVTTVAHVKALIARLAPTGSLTDSQIGAKAFRNSPSDLTQPEQATVQSHLGLGSAAQYNAANTAGNLPIVGSSGKLPATILPADEGVAALSALLHSIATIGDGAWEDASDAGDTGANSYDFALSTEDQNETSNGAARRAMTWQQAVTITAATAGTYYVYLRMPVRHNPAAVRLVQNKGESDEAVWPMASLNQYFTASGGSTRYDDARDFRTIKDHRGDLFNSAQVQITVADGDTLTLQRSDETRFLVDGAALREGSVPSTALERGQLVELLVSDRTGGDTIIRRVGSFTIEDSPDTGYAFRVGDGVAFRTGAALRALRLSTAVTLSNIQFYSDADGELIEHPTDSDITAYEVWRIHDLGVLHAALPDTGDDSLIEKVFDDTVTGGGAILSVSGATVRDSANEAWYFRVGATSEFTLGNALFAADSSNPITVDDIEFWSLADGTLRIRPASADKAVVIWKVDDIAAIRTTVQQAGGALTDAQIGNKAFRNPPGDLTREEQTAVIDALEAASASEITALRAIIRDGALIDLRSIGDLSLGTHTVDRINILGGSTQYIFRQGTSFHSVSGAALLQSRSGAPGAIGVGWEAYSDASGDLIIRANTAITDLEVWEIDDLTILQHAVAEVLQPPSGLSVQDQAAWRQAIGAGQAAQNPVSTRVESVTFAATTAAIGAGTKAAIGAESAEVVQGDGSNELVTLGDDHVTVKAGTYLVYGAFHLTQSVADGVAVLLLEDDATDTNLRIAEKALGATTTALATDFLTVLFLGADTEIQTKFSYRNSSNGNLAAAAGGKLFFARLGLGEIHRAHHTNTAITVDHRVAFFSGPDENFHIGIAAGSAGDDYEVGRVPTGDWDQASGSLDSLGVVRPDGTVSLGATVGDIDPDALYDMDLYQSVSDERHFASTVVTGAQLIGGLGVVVAGAGVRAEDPPTRHHDEAVTSVEASPVPLPYQGGAADVYLFRMKVAAADADDDADRLFVTSDQTSTVVQVRKLEFSAEVRFGDGSVGTDALQDDAVTNPKLSESIRSLLEKLGPLTTAFVDHGPTWRDVADDAEATWAVYNARTGAGSVSDVAGLAYGRAEITKPIGDYRNSFINMEWILRLPLGRDYSRYRVKATVTSVQSNSPLGPGDYTWVVGSPVADFVTEATHLGTDDDYDYWELQFQNVIAFDSGIFQVSEDHLEWLGDIRLPDGSIDGRKLKGHGALQFPAVLARGLNAHQAVRIDGEAQANGIALPRVTNLFTANAAALPQGIALDSANTGAVIQVMRAGVITAADVVADYDGGTAYPYPVYWTRTPRTAGSGTSHWTADKRYASHRQPFGLIVGAASSATIIYWDFLAEPGYYDPEAAQTFYVTGSEVGTAVRADNAGLDDVTWSITALGLADDVGFQVGTRTDTDHFLYFPVFLGRRHPFLRFRVRVGATGSEEFVAEAMLIHGHTHPLGSPLALTWRNSSNDLRGIKVHVERVTIAGENQEFFRIHVVGAGTGFDADTHFIINGQD